MDPQATAGRIVHYYSDNAEMTAPIAAIVNEDTPLDGYACLTVFYPHGPVSYDGIDYAENPTPGCWSWMPYQKQKAQDAAGNQSESAEPRP